jgi:FHS family L-fucose permease-like MFS transporter
MLRGGVFGGGTDQEANKVESLKSIDLSFLLVAGFIALLAFGLWRVRAMLVTKTLSPHEGPHSPFAALKSRWAVAGAAGIFLYVGAEVSVGSVIINFLIQPHVLGVSAEHAGRFLALYWGGAMVGRFIGSGLLAKFRAGPLLLVAATVAGLLCVTVSQAGGIVAAVAVLSIGLFNSIMFPTIFTLTLERSSASPAATSGLLCVAIVGGAVLPQLVGRVADAAGLGVTFLVPALAYFCIAGFAAAAARKAAVRLAEESPH